MHGAKKKKLIKIERTFCSFLTIHILELLLLNEVKKEANKQKTTNEANSTEGLK